MATRQKTTTLDCAEKLLRLAGTYAGDGALQTAIDRTEEAVALLKKEQARREALMSGFLATNKPTVVLRRKTGTVQEDTNATR